MIAPTPCPSCGAPNTADASFCATCSSFLGWDDAATARPAGTAPIPSPAVPAPSLPPSQPIPSPRLPAGRPVPTPSAAPDATAGRRSFLWDDPVSRRRLPGPDRPALPGPRAAADLLRRAPGRGCPECGTENAGGRRFCAHCGYRLVRPAPAVEPDPAPAADQSAWWRHWWRTTDLANRAERRAFRRALPRSYRVRRWLTGVAVLALFAGGGVALVHDPIGWARARWADLTTSYPQVTGIQAEVEPASAALSGYPTTNLFDHEDTAWELAWTATTAGSTGCVGPAQTPTHGTVLRLLLPAPVTVRKVIFWAGLGDTAARPRQWRPKDLALGFADGTCAHVSLADTAAEQSFVLPATVSDEISISVVDTWPAAADHRQDVLAIRDIQVFRRPG